MADADEAAILQFRNNGGLPAAKFSRTVVHYATGTGAQWVSTADMDGDGRLDVLSYMVSGACQWHRNTPDQLWPTTLLRTFSASTGLQPLLAGSFGGAGPVDFASTAGVHLSNGTGRWIEPLAWVDINIADVVGLSAGDLNGDGRTDVVFAMSSGLFWSWNGNDRETSGSRWGWQPIVSGAAPVAVDIADMNGLVRLFRAGRGTTASPNAFGMCVLTASALCFCFVCR